jgi:hypothetical protein
VRDVRGGGALHLPLPHFFVLVKSGKAKDHFGAYYFQTRPDSAGAYIPSLSGARWENWRGDWVIASVEANDCLTLPSDGPRLDRKQWRAKPSLAPEFQFILDRIKSLAAGDLTSMHVVGDFMKRRIASLQKTLEDLQVEQRWGPAHRCMGQRGEHDTDAARGESHPGVGAADVHLRRAPGAGPRRRPPPTPGPDPWHPPGGRGRQALQGGDRVPPDVLPEPRPSHLLGAGDRWSSGRHRRRHPGERTKYCGGGGRALPTGSYR